MYCYFLMNIKIVLYLAFKNRNKLIIQNMKLLEGKVAIITGASRGIGSGIETITIECIECEYDGEPTPSAHDQCLFSLMIFEKIESKRLF